MSSSFMGIEIGRRSIMTHQTALEVTGHNVANANTPGYSRQIANIAATSPWYAPMLTSNSQAGQLGTGVDVTDIQRVRDQFVDSQIRNENKSSGYWTNMQDNLSKIETILNEPSDQGLRTVMDQFWQSWQDLSTNPESESVRAVVVQRGIALGEAFNQSYQQLVDLKNDVNDTIEVKVDQVNSIAKQIADLNKQIMMITATGKQPNDLADKRDYLIDQLSTIADVATYNGNNGLVSIRLGNQMLVEDLEYNQLATKQDSQGMHMVVWADTQNTVKINGGELQGLLDLRGKTDLEAEPSPYKEIISNMLAELNTLAKTIITKTNELQQSGWSLNNKGQNPDRTNFFQEPEGTIDSFTNWAQDMQVTNAVQEDGKNIAAASKPTWDTSGGKANFGDGSIALKIAQLKQSMNSELNEVKQQKSSSVALASDPVNDNVDISLDLNYDGKLLQLVIPASQYPTEEARASAIQTAIADQIGAGVVMVKYEDNRLIFCSDDPKFEGVENLTVSQNGVDNMPATGTISLIQGQIQTGDIAFTANDPINLKIKYGNTIITVNLTNPTYTNLDERAKAIQDAISVQMDTPTAAPAIMVNAYGQSLVFSSADSKLEEVDDLTTGTTGNTNKYGNFHALMIQDATVDDYWRSICASIGVESQEAERMVENQELLLTELENKRQSVSGVSLDEEMTNMIKFQHGYNAAARFITTIDEALNTIINSMGLVGR